MLIAVLNTPTITTYEHHASILLAPTNVFVLTILVESVKVVGTVMSAPLVYIIVSSIKSVVIISALWLLLLKWL